MALMWMRRESSEVFMDQVASLAVKLEVDYPRKSILQVIWNYLVHEGDWLGMPPRVMQHAIMGVILDKEQRSGVTFTTLFEDSD